MTMETYANELRHLVTTFAWQHEDLPEALTAVKLSADAWSLREILGHLIDSASNNHQRFVRLQREAHLVFPSYHYSWIETGRYNELAFAEILPLWKHFNMLLAHLMATVDPAALPHTWALDGGGTITLEALMIDYLRHLKEHLAHFEERLAELQQRPS